MSVILLMASRQSEVKDSGVPQKLESLTAAAALRYLDRVRALREEDEEGRINSQL